MKTKNKIGITLITVLCLGLLSCQGVNDQLIINGVSVGTSTGLSLIKDAEVRVVVANYLQAYAPGLRTITSKPTAEQLAAMIIQYTPQSVQDQYPQVVAFATPLIVNAVLSYLAAYGDDQKTVIQVVNDIATGLELGSAGARNAHHASLSRIQTDAAVVFPLETKYARGSWFCEAVSADGSKLAFYLKAEVAKL